VDILLTKLSEVTSQIKQHSITSGLFYWVNIGHYDQVSESAVDSEMAGVSYTV
jgi:hypothetical protein